MPILAIFGAQGALKVVEMVEDLAQSDQGHGVVILALATLAKHPLVTAT